MAQPKCGILKDLSFKKSASKLHFSRVFSRLGWLLLFKKMCCDVKRYIYCEKLRALRSMPTRETKLQTPFVSYIFKSTRHLASSLPRNCKLLIPRGQGRDLIAKATHFWAFWTERKNLQAESSTRSDKSTRSVICEGFLLSVGCCF